VRKVRILAVSNEALWAIVVLLIGAHYANMVYRLHKIEEDMAQMRKDFSLAAIGAATASANAANAAIAAVM